MSKITLTYFDSPGRAEPIRVALRVSGIPFEDHRLKFPEFMAAKARGDFPLGSVPVFEVDGVKIVQTGAILRYIAKIGDRSLYPEDPWAALVVDSAMDSLNDTWSNALLPSLFERDPVRKLAMRAELAVGPMARVFGYLEALVARSGGPFLTGAAMSVADIMIAMSVLQIRSGGLDGITVEHLTAYPNLDKLADAYLADPRIKALAAK